MLFLRIIPDPAGGLDLVQISDETFRFLLEIEGRRQAIAWLERQGCCPGAAHKLHECEYGAPYQIAAPVDPPGAGRSPPAPAPAFSQDPPGSPPA